jgi:hypothetical protein
LRWHWSLSGREGLGPSLPPAELARQDSCVFEELKRLFSTTPEVRKETEANGGHRGDRTRSLFDRMRPVSVQRLRVSQFFDWTRWRIRSQSIGRVRSTWELTGLQPDTGTVASGQFDSASGRCLSGALLRLDQRVWSVIGPGCPVILRASGPRDEHVRSVLHGVGAVRSARPVSLTSASGHTSRAGQRDFGCFKCLTAIFEDQRVRL